MSYIRHKTTTYPQVIQSKMIAIKVINMLLEGPIRGLESTIDLVCAGVLIQDIHSLIGCYHSYQQAVDNYDADCIT